MELEAFSLPKFNLLDALNCLFTVETGAKLPFSLIFLSIYFSCLGLIGQKQVQIVLPFSGCFPLDEVECTAIICSISHQLHCCKSIVLANVFEEAKC